MTSIWPKSCTSCSVTAPNHWSWPCFIKYRSTFTPCTHHVTPWFTVSSFPPPLQEKESTDWSIEQFSKEPECISFFCYDYTSIPPRNNPWKDHWDIFMTSTISPSPSTSGYDVAWGFPKKRYRWPKPAVWLVDTWHVVSMLRSDWLLRSPPVVTSITVCYLEDFTFPLRPSSIEYVNQVRNNLTIEKQFSIITGTQNALQRKWHKILQSL